MKMPYPKIQVKKKKKDYSALLSYYHIHYYLRYFHDKYDFNELRYIFVSKRKTDISGCKNCKKYLKIFSKITGKKLIFV